MTEDPSTPIPRDETGSYLHLKLKRFPSASALKMPYAIESWKSIPHDAEIDICTSTRSSCRQCHSKINKGELRVRLWLQCHKGCKMSAYFHGDDCVWNYPETSKIYCLEELAGFNDLPLNLQEKVSESFLILKEGHDNQSGGTKKKRRLIDATI